MKATIRLCIIAFFICPLVDVRQGIELIAGEEPVLKGRSLKSWLDQLKSNNTEETYAAVNVLADHANSIGENGIIGLVDALRSEDSYVRNRAIIGLSRSGITVETDDAALVDTVVKGLINSAENGFFPVAGHKGTHTDAFFLMLGENLRHAETNGTVKAVRANILASVK